MPCYHLLLFSYLQANFGSVSVPATFEPPAPQDLGSLGFPSLPPNVGHNVFARNVRIIDKLTFLIQDLLYDGQTFGKLSYIRFSWKPESNGFGFQQSLKHLYRPFLLRHAGAIAHHHTLEIVWWHSAHLNLVKLYTISTQGASQVNLHSEIIKPLWVYNTSLGSDEHS